MLELALFTAPPPVPQAQAQHLRILKSTRVLQFGDYCTWERIGGHEETERRRVLSSNLTGCDQQPGFHARIIFFIFFNVRTPSY